MEFQVLGCGGLTLHGSTSSVALEDLEIGSGGGAKLRGVAAAREILRASALRPQSMPTEATRKRARGGGGRQEDSGPVIPVGFVFADRLHVVRGLAREIFEPVCASVTDELSDGRPLPEDVRFSGRLRPEQERVVGEFLAHLRSLSATGGAMGMITADPGSGKTLMHIALLLLHLRTSCLIVVKGRKIVQQWCRRLTEFGFPQEAVGIVMGGKTVVAGRLVVVASVDTIVSRGAEFPRSLWQRFGVVCFDEAHHITAQTFVSTYLRVAHARFVVGLTGTPDRKDGTTAQMRWFVGPGVASMENQTPTEVRIAECAFGSTPVSLLPGSRKGGGGGGGEFNTAKMISDLGADAPRARWIARLVAGLVPRREKIVVLTGRTDARDDLCRLVRGGFGLDEEGGGGEDQALPGEAEEVPVLRTLPRPDTPYFSCMRRIDELYFRAETEEEKSRPDAALAEKLRAKAARLRLRYEITILRRQIRMVPKGGELRARCDRRKAEMLAAHPFLRTSRIKVDEQREGPLWDYFALEDLQDRVELVANVDASGEEDEEGDEEAEEEEEEEGEGGGGDEEGSKAEEEGGEAAWIEREKVEAERRMDEKGLREILRKEELRIPGFDVVEEVPGEFRKRPLCAVMGSGQTELQAARCEQARVIFSTVHLVREAWDCSGLDTVVLAFPTVDIRQVLGRPRRLTPKMIETGAGALVVDVVDQVEPFSSYVWGRMRIYRQPKYRARISWRIFQNEHDLEGQDKKSAVPDQVAQSESTPPPSSTASSSGGRKILLLGRSVRR